MIKQLRAAAAIAILACTGATLVRAQEVTPAEKERTIQYLESTKKGVLDATRGLSDAQWNFKPGPDRWSIAQVMEHIAAAEDFIRGMVVEKVMLAPAVPDRDVKKIDDGIVAMGKNRRFDSSCISAMASLYNSTHNRRSTSSLTTVFSV